MLELLWFSSYLTFEFWSRDHVVTWLFSEFFVSSNKCPINQPFIWGAKICCSCFGSIVIWLLNFWRFSRLCLILEASRYIHWACHHSWWFSIGTITSVTSHFVIALLVWPQWYAKVRAYRWKREFWNLVPFLGVAHTCNFTNFNF